MGKEQASPLIAVEDLGPAETAACHAAVFVPLFLNL